MSILQALSVVTLILWAGLLGSWFTWRTRVPGTRGRYIAKSLALAFLYPSMAQLLVPGIRDAAMGNTSALTYIGAALSALVWLIIRRELLRDAGDTFFNHWREHLSLRPSTSN